MRIVVRHVDLPPSAAPYRPVAGLGDVVAKIAQATGAAAVIKKLDIDCGCEKRRERLNAHFPISRRAAGESIGIIDSDLQ